MRKGTALSLSLAMALSGVPTQALAEATDLLGEEAGQSVPDTSADLAVEAVVSGTWGTCPWEIDGNGVLTVHPGEGADTGMNSPWRDYRSSITKVVFVADETGKVVLPSDSSYLFEHMGKLTSVDFSGADASKVTSMDSMFRGCGSLTSLDLSGLETSSVTSMSNMFSGCSSLASLDLSGLDTSSVTSMRNMFYGCSKLASLDLSSFDTSSVTTMDAMFSDCASLASLDLSSFDSSSVTSMGTMFSGCSSLTSLDLSSFDTKSVSSMYRTFAGCSSLKTIFVSERWSISNVREGYNTFEGCVSLVGGNGYKYDRNNVTASSARIDRPNEPGYLTLKAEPEPEPAFERANLTVGQQIGLTFWLALPEADGLDYSGSYVELSVDDRAARTERFDLTDGTPRDGEGRYGFTIDLTSVEMAEPVTATFHYADGDEEKATELTYSVQDYFGDFDKVASSYPEKTVDLVHATADLGYYMQPYLARANKWAIGDDYAQITKRYSEAMDLDAAADGLGAHRIEAALGDSGVKASASASFDSLTAVNVFLSVPAGAKLSAVATYGGETYDAVQQPDGRWLVRVEGIRPQHLNKTVTVTGICDGEHFTVDVSVLGLLNAGFSNAATDAKAAFASAYFDWQAARALA